jgi:hypothetical protein
MSVEKLGRDLANDGPSLPDLLKAYRFDAFRALVRMKINTTSPSTAVGSPMTRYQLADEWLVGWDSPLLSCTAMKFARVAIACLRLSVEKTRQRFQVALG